MSNPTYRIAIIGSGPVSLTLGTLLHASSIPFTIYEASPEIRHQGGSLDLHPTTGQQALKDAGLWEQFCKYARPEADVLKLVQAETGAVLWDENIEDKGEARMEEGRPEIDRARLIQILHESLPAESIKFNKKLLSATPTTSSDGKVTYDLHFADNTIVSSNDILVGGDGAWSAVRRFLSDTKPAYSGISSLEVWINDISSNPWALQYIGAGSCFAFGEGLAVQAQRQGDGSLRTYASLRVPEDFIETCGIDWTKEEAREEYVNKYFSEIGPDLQRLVKESKDNVTPRKLYELPVGWTWNPQPGVTLIGDAAHLMTPFAGVGVNVGMTDALVLAREIQSLCKGEKSVDEGLRAYEEEMWPRAEKNAAKTARNKKLHFSKEGAGHMADMLKKMKGVQGH